MTFFDNAIANLIKALKQPKVRSQNGFGSSRKFKRMSRDRKIGVNSQNSEIDFGNVLLVNSRKKYVAVQK